MDQVIEQLLARYCECGSLSHEEATQMCEQSGTLEQLRELVARGAVRFEAGQLVQLPQEVQ